MLTCQIESFTEILDELKPLFPSHYEELALNKDKVPLSPQYDIYLSKDAAGEVLTVTLRDGGKLAGYYIGFIGPGLHYSTCLTLQMDIFYVYPSFRGNGGGSILFKFVEQEAKRRGVQRMFVGSKCHKEASWLFEHLGYDKCEVFYTAWLGD